MNNSGYGLTELIADMHVIIAEAANVREILEQARPLAEWVSQAPANWLHARRFESSSERGFGVNLLHEEGENGLTVCTIVWPPRGYVPPHDHHSWEILTPLYGTVRHSSWRPKADKGEPGAAKIQKTCEFQLQASQAVAIMPDEIHSLENVGPGPSLTMHIYGCGLALVERTRFSRGGPVEQAPTHLS